MQRGVIAVSEFGWVAMHEDGPWHEATYWVEGNPLGFCGESVCGVLADWQHCRKPRPPREQICKRCLRAKEGDNDA